MSGEEFVDGDDGEQIAIYFRNFGDILIGEDVVVDGGEDEFGGDTIFGVDFEDGFDEVDDEAEDVVVLFNEDDGGVETILLVRLLETEAEVEDGDESTTIIDDALDGWWELGEVGNGHHLNNLSNMVDGNAVFLLSKLEG